MFLPVIGAALLALGSLYWLYKRERAQIIRHINLTIRHMRKNGLEPNVVSALETLMSDIRHQRYWR